MKLQFPKIHLRDLFWLTIVVALVAALLIEKRRTLQVAEKLNQNYQEFSHANFVRTAKQRERLKQEREALQRAQRRLVKSSQEFRERVAKFDAEEARAREGKLGSPSNRPQTSVISEPSD